MSFPCYIAKSYHVIYLAKAHHVAYYKLQILFSEIQIYLNCYKSPTTTDLKNLISFNINVAGLTGGQAEQLLSSLHTQALSENNGSISKK